MASAIAQGRIQRRPNLMKSGTLIGFRTNHPAWDGLERIGSEYANYYTIQIPLLNACKNIVI